MPLLPQHATRGMSVQLQVSLSMSGCHSLPGTPLNFHIIKISSFADITTAIQKTVEQGCQNFGSDHVSAV